MQVFSIETFPTSTKCLGQRWPIIRNARLAIPLAKEPFANNVQTVDQLIPSQNPALIRSKLEASLIPTNNLSTLPFPTLTFRYGFHNLQRWWAKNLYYLGIQHSLSILHKQHLSSI